MFILEKKKRIQINKLSFHFKRLGKDEHIKPKANRKEEIIKIRIRKQIN